MPEDQEIVASQLDINEQLQKSVWEGTPIESTPVDLGEKKIEVKSEEVKTPNEEILDPKEWLKREFDVEDPALIKQQLQELKDLRSKAATPAEIKYANDQSKLFHEALLAGDEEKVYSYLDTKRKLSSAEKLQASEVLKLHIAHTNQHYKPEDIQDVYEERYAIPEKPVQGTTELDEDFSAREAQWKSQVDKINRRIERDAIAAKSELAKLHTELVLPEIKPKEQQAAQPTKEELEEAEQYVNSFLASADKTVKEFSGFSTTVKEKDFELSLNYGLSTEEKSFIEAKMKKFAETNFNANAILRENWVDKDGNINVERMTKDLASIYFGEKAYQKFASEGANQRLEQYIKDKKNINLNGGQPGNGTFIPDNKSESQQLQEHFWNN